MSAVFHAIVAGVGRNWSRDEVWTARPLSNADIRPFPTRRDSQLSGLSESRSTEEDDPDVPNVNKTRFEGKGGATMRCSQSTKATDGFENEG